MTVFKVLLPEVVLNTHDTVPETEIGYFSDYDKCSSTPDKETPDGFARVKKDMQEKESIFNVGSQQTNLSLGSQSEITLRTETRRFVLHTCLSIPHTHIKSVYCD